MDIMNTWYIVFLDCMYLCFPTSTPKYRMLSYFFTSGKQVGWEQTSQALSDKKAYLWKQMADIQWACTSHANQCLLIFVPPTCETSSIIWKDGNMLSFTYAVNFKLFSGMGWTNIMDHLVSLRVARMFTCRLGREMEAQPDYKLGTIKLHIYTCYINVNCVFQVSKVNYYFK